MNCHAKSVAVRFLAGALILSQVASTDDALPCGSHCQAKPTGTSSLISHLSPAVKIIPRNSASGVGYFPYETKQLTTEILIDLNATFASLFAFESINHASASNLTVQTTRTCKLMPEDADWPSPDVWSTFDSLLDGGLIQGVPAAAACYEDWPQYDTVKCAQIQSSWTDPAWVADQPTGIDWPINEGMSCLAPGLGDLVSRENSTCTMGGLSQYIVNVSSVAQIQLTVNFARNQNLRLVVKNSGHDFNAKSTGAGALSIWTHFLDDIEYLGENYTSINGYSGPAFKIGAGVSMEQIYEAADAHRLMVVGGIARTIGIAGGYIAGGGNGPLVNTHAMGADQVLSLEVVLPDGTFVSADESTNPDLYFALRGGGGSTLGVVTSVVIRAYPVVPITALTYSFGTGVAEETFWSAIDVFWSYFTLWPDLGIWSYFTISCTDTVNCVLSMAPQLAINLTQTQFEAHMAPFFANISTIGITVNTTFNEYSSFLDMFEGVWPSSTSTCNYWYFHSTSRLFPESNWNNSTMLAYQSAVIRNTTQTRGQFIGYNVRPAASPTLNQDNAINPAWREALMFAQTNVVYGANDTLEEIADANREMVEALQTWRDITPGSYLNEADINEPEWQKSFYGNNYQKLYDLKQKYDPWGLFYAIGAVGSEDWYSTGQIEYYPRATGRLCPAS